MPEEQRVPFLRAAPIEKQLSLFECGIYREPPEDFSAEVADGGEKIIPALVARLNSVDRANSCFKGLLLLIFEKLAERGQLRGRQDVMERLRSVPASIPFAVCRPEAQETLTRVESAYNRTR
jgi:hypothetical protein